MWEHGCHTGNWREYGSEFSAVWSSSQTNWARHYTKDSRLFFVTSYIPLFVVTAFCCHCRCVFKERGVSLFKWTVIINIILSFGVCLLLPLLPSYCRLISTRKQIELTQLVLYIFIGGSGNNMVYSVLYFFFS